MKTLRYLLFASLCVGSIATAVAQDEVKVSISADLVSQYVWRGQKLGDAAIQPALGISYGGFSLSAWGSAGLVNANDDMEFDLTAAYAVGGFNFGVTDYWFSSGLDAHGRYFKYDAHGTNHLFEANIGYDFGPVSLQWYTNFAGNDGTRKEDKRAYSSYFQATAPFEFASCEWEASVGLVPWATTSYGTSGFAVTEVGLKATKALKAGSLTLPIYAGLSANPCAQDCHLYAGFAVQL